jgi:hypothetical protein
VVIVFLNHNFLEIPANLHLYRASILIGLKNNNNNNQSFYSQASCGRLEMKPHDKKNQGQNKSEKEGENKG